MKRSSNNNLQPLQIRHNSNLLAQMPISFACCTRTYNLNECTNIFQQPKRGSLYSYGAAGLPAAQPVAARLPKGADDRFPGEGNKKKKRKQRQRGRGWPCARGTREQGERRSPGASSIFIFSTLVFSLFVLNELSPATCNADTRSVSLSLSFFVAPISLRFLIRPIFSGWFAR